MAKKKQEAKALEPKRAKPKVKDKPYEVGTWKGMTQHRCRLCAFDTLDGEAAILAHLQEAHTPVPPKRPGIIPVYDKWGNQVRPAPVPEPGAQEGTLDG